MGFKKIAKLVVKNTTKLLGDKVTYKLITEEQELIIDGIFDNAFVEINGVNTTRPVLNIDLSQLPRLPSVKDQIVEDGIVYKIVEPRYDGIGGCLLILQRV